MNELGEQSEESVLNNERLFNLQNQFLCEKKNERLFQDFKELRMLLRGGFGEAKN